MGQAQGQDDPRSIHMKQLQMHLRDRWLQSECRELQILQFRTLA